jgi:hypothetical protein
MTRNSYALSIAAALALSLSACGPDEERAATPTDPEIQHRTAQAPSNADGSAYDPNYGDPSIPQNPENKDATKKDSSPATGTGDPPLAKPEG